MHFENDYLFSWLLYLVAVLSSVVVLERMLRPLKARAFKRDLLLWVAAILVWPSQVDPALPYWTPALFSSALEAVSVSVDAAVARILPLAVAAGFGLLLILLLALRRKSKAVKTA